MVNNIETLGLLVENIAPATNDIEVSVNSDIKVKFNSDLNISTIVNNFTVLKDSNLKYRGKQSLKNLSEFEVVAGNLTYDNRTITFKPKEILSENSRYIVCIRNKSIQDILGRSLEVEFISTFFTESKASLGKAEITSPEFGVVCSNAPVIEWISQETNSYILQVAKEKTFEVLLLEQLINEDKNGKIETKYDLSNLDLEDGLYYVRVKSATGSWSNEVQFFIKKHKDEKAVVSQEDTPEEIIFSEYEEEVVVLDYFPKEEDILVNPLINIIYIKVAGELNPELIDFEESYLIGELFDEEDEDNGLEAHDYVNGSWSTVYDNSKDETYIIFSPVLLNETEAE